MDFDDGQSGFVRDATPEPNEPLVEPRPPEQPDQQVLALPEQPEQQTQPDENQEQAVEEDEIIPAIVVQRPSRNRRSRDSNDDGGANVVAPPKRRRLKLDKEVKLSNVAIQENFDTYEVNNSFL